MQQREVHCRAIAIEADYRPLGRMHSNRRLTALRIRLPEERRISLIHSCRWSSRSYLASGEAFTLQRQSCNPADDKIRQGVTDCSCLPSSALRPRRQPCSRSKTVPTRVCTPTILGVTEERLCNGPDPRELKAGAR
jgi:hypothetical protein